MVSLAKEHDILLVDDEVQSGNGRTGTLYAWMQYGFTPDIMSTAKGLGGGLPIGACLLGEKVQDTMGAGTHGSTFGGNPAVCAGALNILSRIDGKLLADVKAKGEYIVKELSGAPGVKGISGQGPHDWHRDGKERRRRARRVHWPTAFSCSPPTARSDSSPR